MKVSVLIFSLFLIGHAKGDILADTWKKYAADTGLIDMEPLNGNELFQSLLKDLGAFMELYESFLDWQFDGKIRFFGDSTYDASITLREAVSSANDSTPANAFDNFMIQHTSFLVQFYEEIKEYLNYNKGIKRIQHTHKEKIIQHIKEKRIQPRLAILRLSDILVNLDRILKTDFSLLSSYVGEIISVGKQGIFYNFAEIMDKYEGRLPMIFSMMRGYLEDAGIYEDTLRKHTSEYVFFHYITIKDGLLRMIPNVYN